MGWFDGFPFKTKAQRERERKEFETRILPYGMEQKGVVLAALRQVMGRKLRDEEKLYTYFNAKDAYAQNGGGEEGLSAALRALSRQQWITQEDKVAVLAMLRLEEHSTSLAEFPTVESIRAEMAQSEIWLP